MPSFVTSMAGSAAKLVHAVVAVLLGHTVPGGGLGLGGVPATSKLTNDVAAAAGPDMDHASAVTATSAAARTGPLRGERTLLTIADLLRRAEARSASRSWIPYPPGAPWMHAKPGPCGGHGPFSIQGPPDPYPFATEALKL